MTSFLRYYWTKYFYDVICSCCQVFVNRPKSTLIDPNISTLLFSSPTSGYSSSLSLNHPNPYLEQPKTVLVSNGFKNLRNCMYVFFEPGTFWKYFLQQTVQYLDHNYDTFWKYFFHLAASEEIVVTPSLIGGSEDAEARVHPDLNSRTGRLTRALNCKI